MAPPRSLQSPLLVGRDDMLALGERRIAAAKSGRGGLVLYAGEAGIGKTRLLKATLRQAALAGFRWSKSDLAPQDSLLPLGSIYDLARTMADQPEFGDLGPDLLALRVAKGVDSLASRRILVREIAEKLAAAIDRPTALAFEDIQWADELSLEVIGALARVAHERPLVLLAAYRSEELPAGSIHREWRSRLLTQRLAEELHLDRLGPADTALMTTLVLATGLPVSREVAEAVFERTNGIPLHIEELLGALGDEVVSDGRSIRGVAVPDTIEDAVLARANRLSADAQAVARAASVMGRCFVPEVLAGVMDRQVSDLDGPLQELVESSFLFPFELVDRGYYDFRHQLLRDALYNSVPPPELRRLHARAGEFGAELVGVNEVHMSLHFERAGLRSQAHRAALAGARAAAAMSSRREAYELFRRAIEHLPHDLTSAEKGAIFAEYADAASAVDNNPAIEEAALAARQHFLEAGNPHGALDALLRLSMVARRDARPRRERLALATQAESELEAIPHDIERASLVAQQRFEQAVLELDAGHFERAEALLEEADASTREAGDDPLDGEAWQAIPRILGGGDPAAMATMLESARRARDARMETAGVSAYRAAAATAIRIMDYPSAEAGIREGLKYADEIQQSFCRSIMAATSAHSAWAGGRWDEAVKIAELELVEPGSRRGAISSRQALGLVALGRGSFDRARAVLDEALAMGRPTGEAELILPALWGLAEAAILAGDPGRSVQHCDEALEIAIQTNEAPLLVPFIATGVRAAVGDKRPAAAQRWLDQVAPVMAGWDGLAGPAMAHADGLIRNASGTLVAARASLETAVAGWDSRGRIWEATWARVDLVACLLRSNRYVEGARLLLEVAETARALGSEPLQRRVEELQRQARGRNSAEEAWYPLTTREFEVAKQIAGGLTNGQIAAELFVSPKTVSAHVEHILAKLGASRRTEIAAWAATIVAPEAEPVAGHA